MTDIPNGTTEHIPEPRLPKTPSSVHLCSNCYGNSSASFFLDSVLKRTFHYLFGIVASHGLTYHRVEPNGCHLDTWSKATATVLLNMYLKTNMFSVASALPDESVYDRLD